MATNKVVFLFDVDNTLLDNDRVTADLRRRLAQAVGQEGQQHYFKIFYLHKEFELEDVQRRYPAEHYVLIDDKLRILAAVKNAWGKNVTTVFPRQGHYATDSNVLKEYPPADISIDRIGELIEYDLSALIEAGQGK